MLRIKNTKYNIEASEEAREKFKGQASTHRNKIITYATIGIASKVLEEYEGTPEYGEALLEVAESVRDAFEETCEVLGKAHITLEI